MILKFIPQYYGKPPPYPTMILNIPTTSVLLVVATLPIVAYCAIGESRLIRMGSWRHFEDLCPFGELTAPYVNATDLVVATCLRIAARDPNGGGCWCRRRRKRKVEKRDKGWLKTLVL